MGLTSLQVCMDSPDWFQGTDSSSPTATTDHILACSQPLMERRLRPPQDQPLKCPRCDSTHTKFCYYNNYSLTQPRYFCKACRRYWTKGGTLRNIPVGGGCRKTKKVTSNSKKSTNTPATASASIHHHHQNLNMININPNPNHNHNNNNNHQLIMNSRDIQLSYPDTSMQFSGSNLFGIGNASNNNNIATSFMFENLSGGGGSQFIGMGGVNHHVINQSYQGGNLCSPFGGMTLDSINNPFSQRGLITYNHNENDVKPNLLALEWQDNDDNINTGVSATSGGSGGGDGGYMTGLGSSWGGLVHGYGPSTTNPLV